MDNINWTANKNQTAWAFPETSSYGLYSCPKCTRTYSHKCTLTRHLRLECGVGPRFQCSLCEKKFKHRHHLRDHEKTHSQHSNLTAQI
ncbi:hypothetical protein KQX54_003990 [Cotesia glomerata]|uniref:C2H2-type domain-containing protein n=1 Tax=Cotesia glomerata TaxID=32391 RepID=A0AAV7I5F5_COTGL|nr:hypothetical protein KQX54_003990 [Cotesia glomerata]